MKLAQPLVIHQYHYSVRRADAVTNHMIFLQRALDDIGIRGSIFAHEVRRSDSLDVRPFDRSSVWNCDVLLIHHSHGNPRLRDLLKVEVPKALVYHNITPPRFFNHDPYLAALSKMGREQLQLMRRDLVAAFAVSRFNSWELETLGFKREPVLPLFHLNETPLPPPHPTDPLRLLFVGKLTAHKNQALLLKVLFYLKRICKRPVSLSLVGTEDPVYARYLKLLARTLNVSDQVHFVGRVSDVALRSYYQDASAFVCVSQHEGFCLPLVEAMQTGVPVFARPVAGIPETLRKAGVHLLTGKPHRIAEIIATCLSDPKTVGKLLEGQAKRLRQLKHTQSNELAQQILSRLGSEMRNRTQRDTHATSDSTRSL